MTPMKPVLSAWTPKKRTTWFAPIALGLYVLSFLVLAFATQNLFVALLLPPLLALGGAYALLGKPTLATKDGKPLVEPKHRPYLFFVLFPLFAILLYLILGTALTQAGAPVKWVAILSILLSLTGAAVGAYRLVGFPNVYATLRKQYDEVPPERRPYLFFPIATVVFLILYLTLGVLTTKLAARIAPSGLTSILNIQVLVLTPVSLALACTVAWLLVGVPPVLTRPAHHLPKVTGKHRPRLFAATLLLGGALMTVILGTLLTNLTHLPPTGTLALAIVLGYALGLGLAALAWGTPAKWRRYDDYRPGLHPRARAPLQVGASLTLGLIAAIAVGLANIDLFWGLLAGALVAGLALLFLTGSHHAVAARRGQPTLVPDLPDGVKPLILFPAWLAISIVLFAILTYALPGIVPVNALLSLAVGLGLTFFLLEQPLLKDIRDERKRERMKRKEWEARRKAKLAEAEQASPPGQD